MGAGALAVRRRKATARLKEDPGGGLAEPPGPQNGSCSQKVFGVPLQELEQRGLTEHGVPTPVRTLVDFLTEHGLAQEGLFRVAGSVRAVEELRRGFESGLPVRLDGGDVSAAASLLKRFVRELPGGLLTSALTPHLLQALLDDQTGAQESCLRDLIRELPHLHYCLLRYLCRFLRKVAEHQAQNRMDIHNLATVFGPNCFHVPPGLEGMKQQDLCNKIMAKILENYDSLFEVDYAESDNRRCEHLGRLILVKEASCRNSLPSLQAEDVERDLPKPPSPKPRLMSSLVLIDRKLFLYNQLRQGYQLSSVSFNTVLEIFPHLLSCFRSVESVLRVYGWTLTHVIGMTEVLYKRQFGNSFQNFDENCLMTREPIQGIYQKTVQPKP
ncbi:protein FAM13A-like [Sorex fumeus]|uniref:protein FAM13A-like n=1 Tax=Sorex fumeus TaxID=62283 RepID=UPI0024AC87D9|nr:protein FAM13A-like [Sorex fumeus]